SSRRRPVGAAPAARGGGAAGARRAWRGVVWAGAAGTGGGPGIPRRLEERLDPVAGRGLRAHQVAQCALAASTARGVGVWRVARLGGQSQLRDQAQPAEVLLERLVIEPAG